MGDLPACGCVRPATTCSPPPGANPFRIEIPDRGTGKGAYDALPRPFAFPGS